MTKVRVVCDYCGDVEFPVGHVTLELGRYRFDCPQCGMTQRRPAGERTVKILSSVGVEGPGPITEDEIRQFVEAIGGTE